MSFSSNSISMIAILKYLCDSPRRTASPLPPGSGAWWWSPCGPWSPCCYHCNQSHSHTQAQLAEPESCLLTTLWLYVPFIVIDTKLLPNEGKEITLSDIEIKSWPSLSLCCLRKTELSSRCSNTFLPSRPSGSRWCLRLTVPPAIKAFILPGLIFLLAP